MLVRDLVGLEFHHHDMRKLDIFSRGGDSRKHEVDLSVVGEGENEFIDNLVLADGAETRTTFVSAGIFPMKWSV